MTEKELSTPKRVEEGALERGVPDEADLKLMRVISFGCGCESYYRYTCGLCRTVAQGEPEKFRKLVEMGMVKHGGYAPYYLTDEGMKLMRDRKLISW